MKKIFLLALSVFSFCGIKAQVSPDYSLFMSQYGLNGTANYIARSGAIGAVGGDIMASHYNPAGLGLFKKSEMSFSSGLNFNFTDGDALVNDASRTSFNYGNFGLIGTMKTGEKGLKYVQLSFGINRLKNFSNRMTMQRDGLTSSFVNDVVIDAIIDAQDAENDFIRAGVVDLDSNNYLSSIYESGTFSQIKSIKESGYINELSFSVSGNVDDKIYFGATMGVPIAYYKSVTSFAETRYDAAGNDNGYYTYNEIQELSAAGINLKAGVIYKPFNALRLGAAIHTPTYYQITDNYCSEVLYNKASGTVAPTLEYAIQSPFRFLGSMAVVLGSNKTALGGTISADYEFADYSAMSYGFENDLLYETNMNNLVESLFRAAHTVRLGGELKLGMIALRAGYSLMSNPYNEPNDAAMNTLSFGFGYKNKNNSFDVAYANISGNRNYQFYDGAIAKISKMNHLIQATYAIRF
ncbi:MAG: hypothetical protein UIQ51_07090 [Bacteroidales bacterium]|nr:hypothetical protein [Bacteroidales bacterium]